METSVLSAGPALRGYGLACLAYVFLIPALWPDAAAARPAGAVLAGALLWLSLWLVWRLRAAGGGASGPGVLWGATLLSLPETGARLVRSMWPGGLGTELPGLVMAESMQGWVFWALFLYLLGAPRDRPGRAVPADGRQSGWLGGLAWWLLLGLVNAFSMLLVPGQAIRPAMWLAACAAGGAVALLAVLVVRWTGAAAARTARGWRFVRVWLLVCLPGAARHVLGGTIGLAEQLASSLLCGVLVVVAVDLFRLLESALSRSIRPTLPGAWRSRGLPTRWFPAGARRSAGSASMRPLQH